MGKKINKDIIDRVIEAADIVDVIGQFVELKDKGARYIGLCPFHDDKHATNFSVYPAKQCYTCFACGAKGDVVKFVREYLKLDFPDAIRWLGNRYGIPVDDVPVDYVPPPPKPKPKPKPTLFLPANFVFDCMDLKQDTLANWMRSIPWNDECKGRAEKVFAEYYLGHDWADLRMRSDMSVFWQIDQNGHVRTGKMMKYKPDGHRDKEAKYGKDWVHTKLIRHYDEKTRKWTTDPPYPFPEIYDPSKQEMRQCLYGMHLLNKYKGATVNIVESEKTAIIMAIAYGNSAEQVWMATGGKENISREKLAPIIEQGRAIRFYPDRDGIKDWDEKVRALNYPLCSLQTREVQEWWKPEDGEKADIADIVVRILHENQNR